ncbi:MAG: ATP-grasp domain-containing protein [Chloroflexi bacterium]|nr:ATP-grasp domain-containing protein [Chloroflexota bacterium]
MLASDQFGGENEYVIPYRNTKALADLSRNSNFKVLGPSPELISAIDDNLYVFSELSRRGILQPKGKIVISSTLETLERNPITLPHVLKCRTSASGSGCYFINNETQLQHFQNEFLGEPLLLSEFISGISLNIHGVITESELHMSAPSIQLVGISECAERAEIYCGNDYAAVEQVSTDIITSVREQTEYVGKWLSSIGYTGIFGVDFVANRDGAYVVDVNPRFQGSTSLLTQLELKAGSITTVEKHISHYLGETPTFNIEQPKRFEKKEVSKFLRGAQIILHLLNKAPVEISGGVSSGIYSFENNVLSFVREGVSVLECRSPMEFALTCAVPLGGTKILPNAPLAKLVFPRSVVDSSFRRLQPDISALTRAIYRQLLSPTIL